MLTLDTLNRLPKTMLQAADGPSQADVYQIRWREQDMVVKDYSNSPGIYQKTVCRWQLRREWLALSRLRRVPNIPRPVQYLDDKVLVMTKLDVKNDGLNEQNAGSLDRSVRLMHQAGVSHNDLHSRNLMLSSSRAYLFDFGSATFRPNSARGVKNKLNGQLYQLGCLVDRMAVAKYKMKHNQAVLREDDQRMVQLVESTRWMSRLWKRLKKRSKHRITRKDQELANLLQSNSHIHGV